MTGFARAEGEVSGCLWTWEAKSVNARGLEVRCRLPQGLESIEPAVRQRVAGAVKRGNVSLTLQVLWISGQQVVRINEDVLQRLLSLVADIQNRLGEFRPPSPDGLLALRGVIETSDSIPTGEAREALEAALLAGVDRALSELARVRRSEGMRLATILASHLDRLAGLCDRAFDLAATQPAAILVRLSQQLTALLGETPALSADRLAQEAALLAAKADPREELDRLRAHEQAAAALLQADGPVGRQLDFLCQEFNREANTLCSKSADLDLTRVGLDLKAVIEQVREQVQNIE